MQRVVGVVARLVLAGRPPAPQQLQRLLPVASVEPFRFCKPFRGFRALQRAGCLNPCFCLNRQHYTA